MKKDLIEFIISVTDITKKEACIVGINSINLEKDKVLDCYRIPDKIDGYTITSYTGRSLSFSSLPIKRLIIPETIKELGNYSLSRNKYLEEVVIESKLDIIGIACFYECSNLQNISFQKDSKLKIYEQAFSFTGLDNLILPPSTVCIKGYALYNCHCLRKLSIPDGTRLYSNALMGCKNLKDIYFLGDSQIVSTSISKSKYVKYHVKSELYNKYITSRKLSKDPRQYQFLDLKIDLIGKGSSCYIDMNLDDKGNNSYEGNIIIPDKIYINREPITVVGIRNFAFAECPNLKSVTLPKVLSMSEDFNRDLIFFNTDCDIIFK